MSGEGGEGEQGTGQWGAGEGGAGAEGARDGRIRGTWEARGVGGVEEQDLPGTSLATFASLSSRDEIYMIKDSFL